MPTKHRFARTPALLAASVLCLILPRHLLAQAVSPVPDRPGDNTEEETIVLSPFIVDASEDAGSYRANSTLAGTRVRTDLKDVASAISVVTKQFLQDTGAKNNEDLLVYTTNTQVSGVMGNFSGSGGGTQFSEDGRLARPQQNTSVRGLDAADNTRDYFLTEIPFDSYNVDRIDLQRGPNSILFGVGSPAGIVNSSVNMATFKNANKVENRVDGHGSLRFSADFNYVLIPKQLAVRVAGLRDDTKYQQKPAFNNDHRLFGAVTYEPHLFEGAGGHTSIRVNFEEGDIKANRPRLLPPLDCITPWFQTGTVTYNGATFRAANKVGISVFDDIDNLPAYDNIAQVTPKSNTGRVYWANTLARYNSGSSTPFLMQESAPYPYANGDESNSIDGLHVTYPSTIATFHDFAQKKIPGGGSYSDKTLSDPSVFDFFNQLIDGPNSNQWQKWHAANFAISQSLFDDRLALQYVYDMQRYADGQHQLMGGSYDLYRLCIDINTDLADGSPNPNFGRPYVANDFERTNTRQEIARDSHRVTLTGELRASDLLGRTKLAEILGKQVFTGLVSQDQKRTHASTWSDVQATLDAATLVGAPTSITSHYRDYNFFVYLGPSLANASTAAGANLSAIDSRIQVPDSAEVQYFDNNWARPTAVDDPNYVNPNAPYTYVNGKHQTITSTQSENPDNYGGWKTATLTYTKAENGDRSQLVTSDSRVFNRVNSKSFTWQGYFFDGTVVPVFGWRRDDIFTHTGAGAQDQTTGIVDQNYDYGTTDQDIRRDVGETKSWGAVVHLPGRLAEKLPLGTDLSVFYNRSSNFKADVPRGDFFGNQIPNPQGHTKEYGFGISTLHDKLTLKVTWYQSEVANATLNGGNLGANSYLLWAVPVWGTGFAANTAEGLMGNNPGYEWMWNWASNDSGTYKALNSPEWASDPSTAKEKAMLEAWKQMPLEQNFFNAYGNEVAQINIAALRAGDWAAADPLWNIKIDNQAASTFAGFAGGPVISVDTVSKGQEFELIAQPTKNWNISVNAAKTFASRNAIAPTMASYIEAMNTWLAGPAGDLRWWGSAADPVRNEWKSNVFNPYQVLLAQRGSNVPEQAPWSFNAVTTYNFDHGPLSGFMIGGGYRWLDKTVLGYELLPDNSNIDISKPLYGQSYSHVDLWAGYSRRISPKINWRIQLNLRSVGEKTKLVPVTLEPDGSVGYSRIQGGMEYTLTNTFEF